MRDLRSAQNLAISAPTVSQRAALACFHPRRSRVEGGGARYDRRDYCPEVARAGTGVPVMPTGGFFVYADSSGFAPDSQTFCRDLLEAVGVAITPGLDFGHHRAEAHVRFAYTIGMANLEDGV